MKENFDKKLNELIRELIIYYSVHIHIKKGKKVKRIKLKNAK